MYVISNRSAVVARRLYECTTRLHDIDLCMRVASMSERLSRTHAREPYKYNACAEAIAHASLDIASGEPGTANSNLRLLYVWPRCLADNGGILPVNTHNITLLLHAPPQAWGKEYGRESDKDAAAVGADSAQDTLALPHLRQGLPMLAPLRDSHRALPCLPQRLHLPALPRLRQALPTHVRSMSTSRESA